MADIFNIAGRIHSTSQEEVVTTTDEILDKSQGKKQSEVNSEVGEELSIHTNRLNALTGQSYITVQATQSTTAADIPTLINASGEGEQADTLYRVGFWDGSAYVADKYTEYAWNGTAYVILDVKSSIGEVFDISQYNAVGGTLTPYADLEAALGVDGANVPSSVRRGGMSIKFVQTSGNKYVQYRLTSNTFSTTVTDWQGVDDEPTAGSQNLVKSGGVYKINRKIGISFISSVNNNKTLLPNIDTVNNILDLGNDPVLLIGDTYYAFRVLFPNNTEYYREIPIFVEGNPTGAIKLVFDLDSKRLFPLPATSILPTNQIVVGSFRLEYDIHKFVSANLPFDYTIDGINEKLDNPLNTKIGIWGDYDYNNAKVEISTVNKTFTINGQIRVQVGSKYVLVGSTAISTSTFIANGQMSEYLIILDTINSILSTKQWYYQLQYNEVLLAIIRTESDYQTFKTLEWAGGTVYIDGKIQEKADNKKRDIKLNILSTELGIFADSSISKIKVGSIYNGVQSGSYDCLYSENYYIPSGSVLQITRAQDIRVRITEYDADLHFVKQTGYDSIDSLELQENTYYIRISASYNLRGYSSSNPISVSAYVDGDFAVSHAESIELDKLDYTGGVYLIGNVIPNIDSYRGILDLGSDPNLFIGRRWYIYTDMVNHRNIPIQQEGGTSQTSSRRKLWFNVKTGIFGTYDYSKQLSDDEVLIGAFVTTYSSTGRYLGVLNQVSLPFNYTINNRPPENNITKIYTGEKPNLPKSYQYSTLFKLSDLGSYSRTVASQGMDIYQDRYLFQGNNPNAAAEENYNNIYIVDLKTMSILGGFEYIKNSHLNTINCGNKYDESDTYPLLYISECYFNHKCDVIRISNDLSSYQSVQSIAYVGQQYMQGFTAYDWTIDIDNLFIYAFGTYNGFTQILKFALPQLSNSDVNFDDSDVLDVIEFSGAYIYQGAKVINNQMYIPFGYGNTQYPAFIKVVDLDRKIVVSHIPLGEFGETEAAALYKKDLVIVNNSTDPIYRLLSF